MCVFITLYGSHKNLSDLFKIVYPASFIKKQKREQSISGRYSSKERFSKGTVLCVLGEDSELLKVWTITKDRIQRKVLLSSCRGFQGLTGFWLLGYLS